MGRFRYVGPLEAVEVAGRVVRPGEVFEVGALPDGAVLSAEFEPVNDKPGKGASKDGE